MSQQEGEIVYVYQISCRDPQVSREIYIGSTVDMNARRDVHSHYARRAGHTNIWLYNHIKSHGGADMWVLEPLDQRVCTTSAEMREFEQEYINRLSPSLNQRSATAGSTAEYRRYQNSYYKHRKAYIKRPLYTNVKALLEHRRLFAPCVLDIITTQPRLRRLCAPV